MKVDPIPGAPNGEPKATIRLFQDAAGNWSCSVERPNGPELIGFEAFFTCTYTSALDAVQEAMDRLNL